MTITILKIKEMKIDLNQL